MSRRPILRWPDPVLALRCAPVERFDAALATLVADLFETMYAAPGRGLAAPQVGVTARVFVVDPGWKTGAPAPLALVNPELLWASDRVAVHEEGCLSIPGVLAAVPRADAVRLAWRDPGGARHEGGFEGIEAVLVQHEFDHLDGIVTLDRLDPEARAAALAAYDGAAS